MKQNTNKNKINAIFIVACMTIIIATISFAYSLYSQHQQKKINIQINNSIEMMQQLSKNFEKDMSKLNFSKVEPALDSKSEGFNDLPARANQRGDELKYDFKMVDILERAINYFPPKQDGGVTAILSLLMASTVVILLISMLLLLIQRMRVRVSDDFYIKNSSEKYSDNNNKETGEIKSSLPDVRKTEEMIKVIMTLTELTIKNLNNEMYIKYMFLILNLIAGICLVCASIFTVLYATPYLEVSNLNSISNYFVLLSKTILIAAINLIAFFFIKAYKQGVESTRSINSEIVNIESKRIGLVMAVSYNEKEIIEYAIKNMLSVERNFILNKDQTTIELEKIRKDEEGNVKVQELVKSLIDAIKSKPTI
ncbi:hypothetical protein ACSSUQ_003845 [Yersinia enterocolitica]